MFLRVGWEKKKKERCAIPPPPPSPTSKQHLILLTEIEPKNKLIIVECKVIQARLKFF